jgi:hypothetical protein
VFLKTRPAAFAAVLTALALGAPVASASAATTPVSVQSSSNPSCPMDYSGPVNLATGCPYWMMS